MIPSWKRWFATLLVPVFAASVLTACGSQPAPKSEPKIKEFTLATTTSTQDSGLLDALIPVFEQKTGYKVKTVAVGTGQALAMGEKGEADVLLVHAPDSEKKVVEQGAAINRRLVMHNDFILVGPAEDPAKVKGMKSTAEAFAAIAKTESLFISRGDESGTHKMEKTFWTKANLKPAGKWYQETGQGMGQTLTMASEKGGYTLTDRATYLANKGKLKLAILVEKEPSLLNIYHVMEVNPEKFPKVNHEGAKAFADFLLEPATQELIGKFGVDKYGEPLFFPDGGKKEEDLTGKK